MIEDSESLHHLDHVPLLIKAMLCVIFMYNNLHICLQLKVVCESQLIPTGHVRRGLSQEVPDVALSANAKWQMETI